MTTTISSLIFVTYTSLIVASLSTFNRSLGIANSDLLTLWTSRVIGNDTQGMREYSTKFNGDMLTHRNGMRGMRGMRACVIHKNGMQADSSKWNARHAGAHDSLQWHARRAGDSSEWNAWYAGRLPRRNGMLGMSYLMQMLVFQREVD